MTRYPGTLLPTLTQPRDTTETRKALLDLLKKVNLVNGDLQGLEAEFDALLAAYLVLIGRIAYTDITNIFTQDQTIKKTGSAAVVSIIDFFASAAAKATFLGQAARGTEAAPDYNQSGDILTMLLSQVWNGSGFSTTGRIRNVASETHTSTARGSDWLFEGVANGATTVNTNLTLTGDGRLYGRALHNNAGAVTGTTNQYIASGTYTPTLDNTTNIAASTAFVTNWKRVGNVVAVWGVVDIDLTSASVASLLGMSLPIASNFTTERFLGGTAYCKTSASGWAITADATNDRASFANSAIADTGNIRYGFNFGYLLN